MDLALSAFQAEIEGRMQVQSQRQTRPEREMKINANWIMPVDIAKLKEEKEEKKNEEVQWKWNSFHIVVCVHY